MKVMILFLRTANFILNSSFFFFHFGLRILWVKVWFRLEFFDLQRINLNKQFVCFNSYRMEYRTAYDRDESDLIIHTNKIIIL